MIRNLPVFGICGWSGSGKTTLIEQLVPLLCAKGLSVVVVKHDAHGIDVDRPGKDSDRFFRAGADVSLGGPRQGVVRTHDTGDRNLEERLRSLCRRYDLVLVEGYKHSPVTKVWLEGAERRPVPDDIGGILRVLPRESDRLGAVMAILEGWLLEQWLKTPVLGCIIFGGSRSAASLQGARAQLDRTAEMLDSVTNGVIVAGRSVVSREVGDRLYLPGVPDTGGPLAGMLAAMRWAPYVSWLVVPSGASGLTSDTLRWVLSTRVPGTWATLPRLTETNSDACTVAHYDFRSHTLLEALAARGILDPACIQGDAKVFCPSIPQGRRPAVRIS